MTSHLKILARGPLAELSLFHLGRINVICGKNNSGKSTLLAGICDNPAPIVGLALTGDSENRLWEITLPTTELSNSAEHLQQKLRGVVRQVLSTSKDSIWFSDQGEHFANVASQSYANSQLARYTWNYAHVGARFASVFPSLERRLLIPAKRALTSPHEISSAENVSPSGGGVLNRLFLWGNRPPGTSERELIDDVRAAFKRISDGYSFFISQSPDSNEVRLLFKRDNAPTWLDADNCGLGLRDLLVLLYFAHEPDSQIIGIEEPESHMHPDMQRRLLSHLRHGTAKQYFLTTHSNVFLSPTLVDKVFFTTFSGSIAVSDVTRRAEILSDLGYSAADNLAPDLVLLVEGPTDKPVYESLLSRLGLSDNFDIKIWPLGGDIMDKSDLSAFGAQKRLLAVIDSDPGSGAIRQQFAENCRELGIPTFTLARYAIENYFPLSAFQKVFGARVPPSLTEIDPNVRVSDQLNIHKAKRRNRELAAATDLDYWKTTDLMNLAQEIEKVCKT